MAANRSRFVDSRKAGRRAADRRREREADRETLRRSQDVADGFESPSRTKNTDRFLAFFKAYVRDPDRSSAEAAEG
jgi:hypothetical protein